MDQSIQALLSAAGEGGIAAAALKDQEILSGVPACAIRERMRETLSVMRSAAAEGFRPDARSLSGIVGGNAALLLSHADKSPGGKTLGKAAARALAIAEHNACMGKIVATPTAGACGILPAALLTLQEERGYSDEQLIDALLVAAAIGRVIAKRASISGAEGGCQAECGSAAAMTAAAITELAGGTPDMAADACTFALMNSLGLVCDPVGGLVEVPCVYRNVGGVAIAFTAADLALSGIRAPIAADDMIDTMKAVGDLIPSSLRETGEGGCAACHLRGGLDVTP